ncbi:hypothetical protein SDC9_179970 [bioreactor metagenome]|uniref:Uncharacterized protein n=1 Tax=bioreactor metagenome TaxID=1076179 RepID=A0A645H0B3_9ZZZZ
MVGRSIDPPVPQQRYLSVRQQHVRYHLRLARQVAALDEHRAAAELFYLARRRGHAVDVVDLHPRQFLRLGQIGRDDHRHRHDDILHRVHGVGGEQGVPALRHHHGIDDDLLYPQLGKPFGDGGDRLAVAEHPRLDRVERKILADGHHLRLDYLRRRVVDAGHAERVLHGQRRYRRGAEDL